MRQAFIRTLVDLADEDERILLMTGDLGYMAIEPFAERFPRRFFNVGVAEQNLVGLATGLSESGFIPFIYSITTFVAMRAYEFIRNGPLAHGLPVRIIGIGGGFEYGACRRYAFWRRRHRRHARATGTASHCSRRPRAGGIGAAGDLAARRADLLPAWQRRPEHRSRA